MKIRQVTQQVTEKVTEQEFVPQWVVFNKHNEAVALFRRKIGAEKVASVFDREFPSTAPYTIDFVEGELDERPELHGTRVN